MSEVCVCVTSRLQVDDYTSLGWLTIKIPHIRHYTEIFHMQYRALHVSHSLIRLVFVELHSHGSWKVASASNTLQVQHVWCSEAVACSPWEMRVLKFRVFFSLSLSRSGLIQILSHSSFSSFLGFTCFFLFFFCVCFLSLHVPHLLLAQ